MNKEIDNQKEIQKLLQDIISDNNEKDPLKKLIDLEKKYPNDIVIKQVISGKFLQSGKNDQALNYLKSALEMDPNNFSINYNMGIFYRKFKKINEAKDFFEKSISLNKDFKEGFNSLGDIYYEEGNFSKANEYYTKSFNLDPGKTNIKHIGKLAESYFRLSTNSTNSDEITKAKEFYLILNEIDPGNDIVLNNLIFIYNIMGQKDEAVLIENQLNGSIIMNDNKNEVILKVK